MESELIRRRHLPHWDVPDAPYFVTTCLRGSISAQGLLEISKSRLDLRQKARPAGLTDEEWKIRCWKQGFVCVEDWLDFRSTNRALENPKLSQIVMDAIRFFAGERYDLYAFVVMPSHIHWVFKPLSEWVATLGNGGVLPQSELDFPAFVVKQP